MQISPLPIAEELWDASPTHGPNGAASSAAPQQLLEAPSK